MQMQIKAEGKERFLIKETWTESNRTVMGKVFILPEINNKHLFNKDIGLSSLGGARHNKKLLSACSSYPNFAYEFYNPEYLMDKIRSHLNQWASLSSNSKSNSNETERRSNVYENRTVSQTVGTNQPSTNNNSENTQDNESSDISTNRTTTNTETASITTTTAAAAVTTDTQPVSVNTTRTVVTRIIPVNDSDEEDEDSESGFSYAPSNPLEFSYWVLANLPLEDHQRLILLSLNSPIQRLRWQSSFFEKYLSLSCIRCNCLICNCEGVYSKTERFESRFDLY